jgi:hypothetical protein
LLVAAASFVTWPPSLPGDRASWAVSLSGLVCVPASDGELEDELQATVTIEQATRVKRREQLMVGG